MPKGFAQLNYYDMLDLKPGAEAFEIRHAYNAAMQMYQPGSLASYSFFSEEERRDILALIEKAYQTLINEQSRHDYDEELIRQGELPARTEVVIVDKKPVSIFEISRAPALKNALTDNESIRQRISQSQNICGILAQNDICGADLKKIRTELEIPIEQISHETKVRLDHLRNIEEDNVERLPVAVFLKGFVKSYLKCLCLGPVEEISTRYMNNIANLTRK